jgi:hypothetical protein
LRTPARHFILARFKLPQNDHLSFQFHPPFETVILSTQKKKVENQHNKQTHKSVNHLHPSLLISQLIETTAPIGMATETSGQEERVEPKSYGSSTFCQFIVLILTGVLALYATDVIEITADFSRPVGASGTIITDGEVQGIPITESKRPEDVVVKPKKETEPGKKDVQEGANSQPVNLEHRRTYKRRGQPRSDDNRQAMTEKWGSWTVIDDKERPTDDYYATYPTRDIPRADFPSNAWQIDKDYLSKFLPESIALVQRAQEAILAEYGKTEGSWEERAKMFEVTAIDEASGADAKNSDAKKKGGWTTKKSWAGLKRRLLHAIMTEGKRAQ